MLNGAEADLLVTEHLGDTPRAAHSRFVAHLMRRLAETLGADPDLWEVVGLCHDLDFFETSGDPSQHGVLVLQWLGDRIPAEAQGAIAAHDHRTGITADFLLADMLKLADAVAVIDARLGRPLLCGLDRGDPFPELRRELGNRGYLCDMLERYAGRHALPIGRVLDIVAASPAGIGQI